MLRRSLVRNLHLNRLWRYKGVVYQRKKNMVSTKSNQHMPKVKTPPPLDLNIDLGNWLSTAKIFVPIIEILKIPSQRDILGKP